MVIIFHCVCGCTERIAGHHCALCVWVFRACSWSSLCTECGCIERVAGHHYALCVWVYRARSWSSLCTVFVGVLSM